MSKLYITAITSPGSTPEETLTEALDALSTVEGIESASGTVGMLGKRQDRRYKAETAWEDAVRAQRGRK